MKPSNITTLQYQSSLLSPSNLQSKQQYYGKNSYKKIPSLDDSHSTVHSSQICHLKQGTKSKFYAFRRLKESKIRQKNQTGAITIKQIIKEPSVQFKKMHKRLKTLDDAITIQSHVSPRSSRSNQNYVIQQSVIIMRENFIQNYTDQPLTPYFRKTNSLKQIKRQKTDYVKVFPDQNLMYCIESSLLCHYQIIKEPLNNQILSFISESQNNSILSIYAKFPIYYEDTELFLVAYEPYLQTLQTFICRKQSIDLGKLLQIYAQIIKLLCQLRDKCIYISLDIRKSIYFIGDMMKIKIIPSDNSQVCEAQMLRKCGILFVQLLQKFQKESFWQQNKLVNKIKQFSIAKRIQLIDILNQFIYEQNFTLDEGYVRIQTFQL